MNLAPIVLFCYNRPSHTEQTLMALNKNTLANKSQLFIFCDGPKTDASEEQKAKIENVRKIVKSKDWCGKISVFESPVNKGLAQSVIEGVTKIVNEYGKVIVLEDDLITSSCFLEYMNNALEKYKLEDKVMQISGHQFPTFDIKSKNESFFLPFTTSWGWATWSRAWSQFDERALGYESLKTNNDLKDKFNLDNTYPYSSMLINQMETKSVDSWAIRWWWSVFKKNGLVLFPDKSLVKNVGFGTDGTHTKGQDPFEIIDFNINYSIINFPDKVSVSEINYESIKLYIRHALKLHVKTMPRFYRILNKILTNLDKHFFNTKNNNFNSN